MKKFLICLVFITLWVGFVHGQSKTKRNNVANCLSVTQAEDLIPNLRVFRDGDLFLMPSGTSSYSLHDLPTMKRNFPILYLFYQRGYVNLEYNGVHTFSTLTSRGEQLDRQYNGSIPLAEVTLVKVNRITCARNKAKIDVTISMKPTRTAVDLLGNTIYKTKPFGTNSKILIEARRTSGRWVLDEYSAISLS